MSLGKKRLLTAFLEKDNLKLLVYDVLGRRATRVFAGQISFSPEVLRDAYIADAIKFASQLKIAFNQKDFLRDAAEVALFVPPDKAFTKSLPVTDAVDGFVQSLPYFKEELILSTEEIKSKTSGRTMVTHVAFEKKLIEDFEKPFLESGKKVLSVRSSASVLGANVTAEGKYFLLAPFEKEIAVAVAESGAVIEMAAFAKDVFLTRFGEYIVNHDLGKVGQVYTVGVFDAGLAEQIRLTRGMEVSALSTGDIYDEVVVNFLRGSSGGLVGNLLGRLDLSAVSGRMPNRKYVFLGLAAIVGIILVIMVVKGAGKLSMLGQKQPTVSPVATTPPPPAPEPKPADYKVRVLNGTLVEGEAGRLADKLKGLGFEVTETKNATTAGFVTSRLRTAADVPGKITDKVKSALTDTYDSVSLEQLASDSAGVKIEIIIGKKK